MGKGSIDEVQVLKFFETAPIEKAAAVFNIVAEKVRERLRVPAEGEAAPRAPRKRQAPARAELPKEDPPSAA